MDTAANTDETNGATTTTYRTRGGIWVRRRTRACDGDAAIEACIGSLDARRGAVLTSGFEYPGRYTRWDLGFVDPPLVVQTTPERKIEVKALNGRGILLLPSIARALSAAPHVARVELACDRVRAEIAEGGDELPEELRSRRPTVISAVRAIRDVFAAPEDEHLGLYGAFGYDLVFGFEPLARRLERSPEQRDLVLYLPDALVVHDRARGISVVHEYDFACDGGSTERMPREGEPELRPARRAAPGAPCDHAEGEYEAAVERAREAFARGELFEVVLSQTFRQATSLAASALFRRLRVSNPSPYGFLLALGEGEHLVGASPEMFVRVQGDRVETCPIAGTTARGGDALEDAVQIRSLLNSEKDEWELTMCTDVDRNDKARVCVPGSVRVIGRRQVELYSRLIHTVDHVEGRLRPELDALDAFLSHAWAVTVTGAPKPAAMQFIEDHERSPRGFYSGAIGVVGFDGSLNTGLALRMIRLCGGVAEVRAGATLLHASDAAAEERECRLKAAALFDVLRELPEEDAAPKSIAGGETRAQRILLVDHRDSFVHTLGAYLRQSGADVVTYRAGFAPSLLERVDPSLVVLSPGPGRPEDFGLSRTLAMAIERGVPVFGVCLGLQGIVEHFGGTLDVLATPMHGRPSPVRVHGGALFDGLPRAFPVGRYHSLHAVRETLPACLRVTAEDEAGVVMAVEHEALPIAAVQFHPESIMTPEAHGHRMIANALRLSPRDPLRSRVAA